MKSEGFPKSERIVSQKVIDWLFSGDGSHSVAAFPVRAVFATSQRAAGQPAATLLVSVPKRRFKHAVDRNRIKRQLREAWRRQRALLWQAAGEQLTVSVALVWLSGQHMPSEQVEKRVATALQRVAERLKEVEGR